MSKNVDALNDVRRKINEVLTKSDQRIVVGWRPGLEQERKEGDVWETSDGSEWTVKNGIRQKVTKLDTAKTPWWCPHCSKPLNHRIDVKFYHTRGYCLDCHTKTETEIRRLGKWEEYERSLLLRNYTATLVDKIAELKNYYETITAPEIIHADEQEKRILMVEKWDVDINKIKEDLKEEVSRLEILLEEALQQNEDLVDTLTMPIKDYVNVLIGKGETSNEQGS